MFEKGKCPWCKRPVKRGGILFWNNWWHRSCYRQRQGHDEYGRPITVKIPKTYTGDRG